MTEAPLPAVPSNWSWTELGDVLSGIEAGKSFKCEERPPKNTEVGVVKVSAVTWGTFDEDASKTCLSSERVDPKLFIQPGDFLFSRANTIQLVGACVIVRELSRRLMLSDKILRFRVQGVVPQWLLNVLRTSWGRAEIERLATGNQESMRNIGQDRICAIRIPVPPLEEQRRIVAEVDRYLSVLDTGTSLLTSLNHKVSKFEDAVLSTILSPVTCPRQPSDGGLRRHILAERKRRGGTSIPLQPDNSLGLVAPPGWEIMSLDELTTRITSGSRDWSPYYGRGNGTFILAQNVRRGRLDLSVKQSVDPPQPDSSVQRSLVKRGDLLITIVGAVGDTCAVTQELDQHYVCQSVAMARPVLSQLSKYLMFWLLAPGAGATYFKNCSYGQGRPHLSFNQIKRTPVLVPPLDVMNVVVTQIEDHLSLAEAVAVTVGDSQRRADSLRQAILKKAFEGKLVPQDPNDEPASVLLERIRATRVQTPARPRRKREVHV